jgi:hypothetical protein
MLTAEMRSMKRLKLYATSRARTVEVRKLLIVTAKKHMCVAPSENTARSKLTWTSCIYCLVFLDNNTSFSPDNHFTSQSTHVCHRD